MSSVKFLAIQDGQTNMTGFIGLHISQMDKKANR